MKASYRHSRKSGNPALPRFSRCAFRAFARTYFDAGHMMGVRDAALARLSADIGSFIRKR